MDSKDSPAKKNSKNVLRLFDFAELAASPVEGGGPLS
jgi:hypothetical protein